MNFEGFSSCKWPAMATNNRSKSCPENRGPGEDKLGQSTEAANRQKLDIGYLNGCTTSKKKQSSVAEIQHSLRQEILQLEKILQDEVLIRCVLEKALGFRVSSHDITNETAIPKPASELIREIAALELEVGGLEQYLLSLYRQAFDQQISSLSPSKRDEEFKSPLVTPRRDFSRADITAVRENFTLKAETQTQSDLRKESDDGLFEEKLIDSGVQRSHSSLSQYSAQANISSPPADVLGKAVRACHSQPLSMMEYDQKASSPVTSLAEHLGTHISDHIVADTPNKLSQDMVKCMSDIYCRLADPPLANHSLSSRTSSLSSTSEFSPEDQYDSWSPRLRNNSFDVRLNNPFHVEGLKDFSGPYSTMVEVNRIYRDGQKLNDIEFLLEHFRSLVSRLEAVDPGKMTHEEKLAFWVNVHNAMVMHAFLAYGNGIPQNNLKRMFLLLKASYNVGGQVVSAHVIQTSILGCRMSRPGQWLRLLLSSKTKLKAGDQQQTYAIERPEPLLYFALSCGSHSDPAVRIYTPKMVFQELEAAKNDYIRATFGIQKDHKILLPKIVEYFSKDSGLCPAEIIEMIQQPLPDSLRKSFKKLQLGKSHKNIEWAPHNFAFRYLILKDLGK
ncbi:hypothetical protein DH2020_012315 [Rehmannia glutinosa]|uniref:Uncharacterized protein n=1 Tax=Rehmannia glutinosa TaxID=99300 RepID=A0ABR0WZE9_REHGL